MTAQPPVGQTDGSSGLVARLRAEHAAQQDKSIQALLLHECGVLEETGGEEPSAARDYLAAFNTDPQFREPLESLVRILSRRKSVKNLGKLLDALTRAATTPEEKARAFWERAAYLQAYEQNVAAAKEILEEAISASPEDPSLWLELELCAAKEGDLAGRMRALEARAELASNPSWKALLFIDLAELSATAGDTSRAYELLGTAAALEGQARFRTQVVLEQVASRDRNLETLARALEGQADLIEEAIEDGERGDATGVPRYMRRPEYAADAWLRGAAVLRRMGDVKGAAGMFERAGARLPGSAAIARARLSALEAAGDLAGAAELAKAELGRGVLGPGTAALWLRLAEAASAQNDRDGALDALRNALQFDRESIPARALEIDQLLSGQDPAALASALEAAAETLSHAPSKGRSYLLAAYVWGAEAGDVSAARAALAQANACGTPVSVTARIGRSLASLRDDAAWFEEATGQLLSADTEPTELRGLWLEIGRSKLLRRDEAGASEAFVKLGAIDDGSGATAWLGRVLAAYAVPLAKAEDAERRPLPSVALEELAKVEPDPEAARALWLIAALRSAQGGDVEPARLRLRELSEQSPSDLVIAVFLSELERRAGDLRAAAVALSRAARECGDDELGAALHLEAGLLLWRAGDRSSALEEFEAARASAPRAGATVLTWALRGADPDTIEGRRRALEIAAEAGANPMSIALERFGLEASAGDPIESLTALEALENDAEDDLAVAAALARILWPQALEQRSAVDRALARLEDCVGDGMAIARAERFRLARALDQDRALAVMRAETWHEADPKLYAALEWIGAAIAAEDREGEVAARRAAATHLSGAAKAAMEASAAVVGLLDRPMAARGFIQSDEAPAQLINLEIALPGSDPRRRAAALNGLGAALGDDAKLDAMSLAGWSELAAGNYEAARDAFQAVIEHRPDDIGCWEGVRSASEALGDHVQTALACAQLGAKCKDDERGAAFWEKAGIILLEHTDAKEDAEIAFERAFERSPSRSIAFDKLFRAVRARNEDNKLLTIIDKRLDVSEDDQEIGKMYWERARVLRKKGDLDGALSALENVTMLESDHVGALALLGEVCITKGDFAGAAPYLARLAKIDEAPKQQRLMSGIAAVDLFENKLGQPEKALDVLLSLHKSGLSTLPVRERLARVAIRSGAWGEATSILEELMAERDKREGRIEAARLGMTIWRDKLNVPVRAEAAVTRLLDEAHDDTEAVEFVMDTSFDAPFKMRMLGRAKQTLLAALASSPADGERVELLSKIAAYHEDRPLRQATLGAMVALGRKISESSKELKTLDERVAARPQIVLDERALAEIADQQDTGPLTELFLLIAETASLALGPTLVSLSVGRRDRIDARGAHPLRVAVAEWMGAVGLTGDFDLYVGGPDPHAVHGIPGDEPALVLGSEITAPFNAAARTAVAREVFALKRGITTLRTRDDNTVASLVFAACIEAGFQVSPPPYAVFGEVSRAVHKEIPRKVRKAIPDICQRILSSGQDPRQWAAAARRSIDRMAAIAAGDVSIVLSDVLNTPRDKLESRVADSERARRLLGFVLSPSYLELRKKLGMGVR